MAEIGFIGLGHMGGPMVANLLKAGHSVKVFDKTPAAISCCISLGATAAASLQDLITDVECVISMLPEGEHVREVYLGESGVLSLCDKSILCIDSSTIDIDSAKRVHERADALGIALVDAPVSGGTAAAQAGTLTFMVGGTEQAYKRAELILTAMGKNIFHAGPASSGQAAKICNNMLLGISMIGVCETFKLGEKLGLEAQTLFDICNTASGQCWSLTEYCPAPGPVPKAPSNRDYQPGFMAKMMLKDLRLSQNAAQVVNAYTPLGESATKLYAQFCERGDADTDFSGIINMIADYQD